MSVLAELLNGVMDIDRDADAIDFEGCWYSWGEVGNTVRSVKQVVAGLGLGSDARIGVFVRNRPATIAALMAVVMEQACFVSINPLLPEERLADDIAALELPVIVAESIDLDRTGILAAAAAAGTALIEITPVLGEARLRLAATVGTAVRRSEPGVIIEMLTSGTTGAPKRIPLGRAAFEESFESALSYEKDRKPGNAAALRPGTMILSNPMTHIGGLWGALTCIAGGRKACLLERFTVPSWRDAIVRHRPKVASAVPAGLTMLLDADIPKEDLSSLVALRTGAAPLDPAVADAFLERYDLPVLSNYGATELSGAVAGWGLGEFRKYWPTKRGSVGRFQPGVTGRIIDSGSGEEMPVGEEGVLEMQSAQFGNEGAWLRTTDRASIDEDGFLFIHGRADLAINRGGFKVHPDDVNSVYERHPAVREAVTVGIADRRLGTVPATVLMLKSGASIPDNGELIAFGRERMMPYQVPVHFLIVNDVPRTPSMKPALPAVRALFDKTAAPTGEK